MNELVLPVDLEFVQRFIFGKALGVGRGGSGPEAHEGERQTEASDDHRTKLNDDALSLGGKIPRQVTAQAIESLIHQLETAFQFLPDELNLLAQLLSHGRDVLLDQQEILLHQQEILFGCQGVTHVPLHRIHDRPRLVGRDGEALHRRWQVQRMKRK